MLHAGIGLAFAETVLASLSTSTPAGAVRAKIEEFLRLCRDNSRPGYIGAAYESLGLFTRSFHESLVPIIDCELQPFGDELLGYYWHGVGRAIYFAPRNFLPCADIDWATTPQLAPHELGRLNITAGLAWAVTLVNMQQPAVMELLLHRSGDVLSRTPAFANGVASAVMMRYDTTPDAPFIPAFVEHRPAPSNPALVCEWEALIRGPVMSALQYLYGPLKQQGRLGEIFRFAPMTTPPA